MACSTDCGSWDSSRRLSADSSCGWSSSIGMSYRARKRAVAESTSVAVRARVHERHRDAEALVHAAKLSEIREFARAGNVANRRKERVLDERPKQHVRAEEVRRRSGLLGQCLDRKRALAGDEMIALPANGAPRAVEMKERDAVRLGEDLRLMSAGRQRVARGLGERRGSAGGAELAREQVGDERLGRGIRRVVNHQPVGAEQRFEPPGKGVGHAEAWPVRVAERGHEPLRELGFAECARDLIKTVLDAAIQHERGNRSLAGALGLGQRDRVRLEAWVEPRTAGDFLPVVIFGVDPEHRNDFCLLFACGVAGQLDGGDGLEQREERSAEGAGLLSGEDRRPSRCRRASVRLRGRPVEHRAAPAGLRGVRRPPRAVGSSRACGRLPRSRPVAGTDRRRTAVRLWRSQRRSPRREAGSSQSGARRSLCGSSRRRTSFPLSPPRTLSEPCKSCQEPGQHGQHEQHGNRNRVRAVHDHLETSTHFAKLRVPHAGKPW